MGMYQVVATKDMPKAIGDGMAVYAVSRNDGKKGKSGIVCVAPAISGPTVAVFQNDAIGAAFIADCIAGLRSKIISKLHASNLVVSDDAIGITALLALATQEVNGTRMTAAAIGEWFDSDLAALVSGAIKAKMVGIADDKLGKLVAGYKDRFQSLSGRDVSMPDAVKASMMRAIALLPEGYDSVIGEKVITKLDSVSEAGEVALAL